MLYYWFVGSCAEVWNARSLFKVRIIIIIPLLPLLHFVHMTHIYENAEEFIRIESTTGSSRRAVCLRYPYATIAYGI